MTVDLTSVVKPGDTVVWGQGCGEPRTLTEALIAQRHALRGISVFLGATFSETLRPEHADCIRFIGIGGIGRNSELTRTGSLDVLPCHVSDLPEFFASGSLPVDVAMVQVSPGGTDGTHSLGLVGDYLEAAMASARVVIAEINQQVPFVSGPQRVSSDRFDFVVHSDRAPVELVGREPSAEEVRLGEFVAGVIPDGAVIQLGVGSAPAAVALALRGHRDLSLHSGVVGDWLVDLVESGAINNTSKPLDRGVSVTGGLFGTRRLFHFADHNPELELHPLTYTHSRRVLDRLENLYTVNSAVEVDLTGQVNSETVKGVHIGTVGGQVDFVRAGNSSPGGRSIIALLSTSLGGRRSRIVPEVMGPVVTTCRSDVDLVVTEFGVAELRGASLSQRAERLIAVAHPDHHESLVEAVARGSARR